MRYTKVNNLNYLWGLYYNDIFYKPIRCKNLNVKSNERLQLSDQCSGVKSKSLMLWNIKAGRCKVVENENRTPPKNCIYCVCESKQSLTQTQRMIANKCVLCNYSLLKWACKVWPHIGLIVARWEPVALFFIRCLRAVSRLFEWWTCAWCYRI